MKHKVGRKGQRGGDNYKKGSEEGGLIPSDFFTFTWLQSRSISLPILCKLARNWRRNRNWVEVRDGEESLVFFFYLSLICSSIRRR
jgi:hypothetical protein